jgi:hypothetical protein
MTEKLESSSELLLQITQHKGDTITVGEMVTIFKTGGFSLLLIVFAGPLALPLPALGIAQVLSVPILFLAIQLASGRSAPWLPQKIANKNMSMETLGKVIPKVIPWLKKIEFFVRPRLGFFASKTGHCITGIACFVCAISVAMPFPFSNTVPSMGIVIMSIGLLERDGLAILAGMCVGAAGVCIAIAVMYFGVEAVMAIVDVVKDWLGFATEVASEKAASPARE